MEKDYEFSEQADISINDNLERSTFDEVSDILDYEKDSPTIQKEVTEFDGFSNEKKEQLKEAVESVGSGFDFLDDTTSLDSIIEDSETAKNEQQEEAEIEETIEEYFQSAEFMIFIIDLAIV